MDEVTIPFSSKPINALKIGLSSKEDTSHGPSPSVGPH